MTEEEKVEWAKNYSLSTFKKKTQSAIASSKKPAVYGSLKVNERMRKKYHTGAKRNTSWGPRYNERNRYLYKYNEHYRNTIKYRVYLREFTMRKESLTDRWADRYYKKYKDRMNDYAHTFKLENNELYVHGFTVNDLKMGPVGVALLKGFIQQGVMPPPKYRGYKYDGNKFHKEISEFYLVSEVEIYFNVFARYRRLYRRVKHEEQELYLKKELWVAMLKARKEFDE